MKSISIFHLTARWWFAILLAAQVSGQETQRQYLSGHDKDDAVPWKFFCTAGAQSGSWTNIPVPSNWELRGFGTLNYHGEPTNTFAEQGRYERDFAVPADWSQRRVFLVFDGVMTDTRADINGQSAGPEHQGGFYRFKYEVTKLLKFNATNRLEVLVHKRSANASVNEAERRGDYWLFGGIYRPVYLEAVPQQFIQRVAIDARADGAFAMDVFVDGATSADSIEAQVVELDGKPVGESFSSTVFVPSLSHPMGEGGRRPGEGNSESRATLRTQIASPRQWTAETPNLYRVEVRLKRGDQVLHRFAQRFGFRTMEVRPGDGLYVNGRRVVLKGCDRHSFWPDSGRCLSEAIHRLDINLMKDMNMNAVRMSHYPPDEKFLDSCDELGLYVLDELAGWQHHYDTPTGRRLVEEMVTRDVNHPSILFWDNANEGGWNTELDGDFARWDPQQRHVLHPGATFGDVNAAHYRAYDNVKAICAGNVIYMPTEFLHGLYDGGAGAGMEDYWELMRNSKVIGGGFVWAFLDEGVRHPDTGRIDVFGDQAPDGIVGPYRQKEASFYTIKELWSPIVVNRSVTARPGEDYLLAWVATNHLHIENRYSFTDANQCRFAWRLVRFNLQAGASPMNARSVLATGELKVPSIQPGGTGDLELKLPKQWQQAAALELQVSDPSGRVIWNHVWRLFSTEHFLTAMETRSRQKVRARETADAIEVAAGDLTVRFSKRTGMLAGVQRGAQKFSLSNGPRPAMGGATLTNLETMADGTDYVVAAKFVGNLNSVSWRVRGNGWVQCDYVYTATGPLDFHGVAFDYPEQFVKKKKWLGDGPYRVWKNRSRGVTFGVWKNDYNNTITGWRDWVYPEFKGCFADVRWLRLETTEGSITVVPDNIPFVQVLTPEFPPANLAGKTAPPLPKSGLAFLGAIPPMGNKFRTAQESGPQGQPNIATGQYTNSVSFYFGPLPPGVPVK